MEMNIFGYGLCRCRKRSESRDGLLYSPAVIAVATFTADSSTETLGFPATAGWAKECTEGMKPPGYDPLRVDETVLTSVDVRS